MLRSLLKYVDVSRHMICHPPAGNIIFRPISSSVTCCLKKISVEKIDDNTTVVEGKFYESERKPFLIENKEGKCSCSLCNLQIDLLHTDVLILSQFMRSDGGLYPKRVTGLCAQQQKRVTWLVAMAQKAGLVSSLAPPQSKRDPLKRYGPKRYHRYFDENTMPGYRPKPTKVMPRFVVDDL